jgi:hypothetical protein
MGMDCLMAQGSSLLPIVGATFLAQWYLVPHMGMKRWADWQYPPRLSSPSCTAPCCSAHTHTHLHDTLLWLMALWTSLLNLSIPNVPFPVLLSTLIRSRFQAKPATILIPIDIPFLFAVEEVYGTRYQNGSFSLIYVGSGSHCLHIFSFILFLLGRSTNKTKERWLRKDMSNEHPRMLTHTQYVILKETF